MKRMRKLSLLLVIAFAVSSCAITSSVSVSDTGQASGKEVSAEVSHFNILYLFPAKNIDQVTKNLKSQCSSGEVTGITTQFFARTLGVGAIEKVIATGTCVE